MKNLTAFTIIVHGKGGESTSHQSVQQFITAAITLGHHINGVFFYADGASICARFEKDSETKIDVQQSWLQLSHSYSFPLQACVSSAIRRGVSDPQNFQQTGKTVNLLDGFELEGLGVLAQAIHAKHQIIEFGS